MPWAVAPNSSSLPPTALRHPRHRPLALAMAAALAVLPGRAQPAAPLPLPPRCAEAQAQHPRLTIASQGLAASLGPEAAKRGAASQQILGVVSEFVGKYGVMTGLVALDASVAVAGVPFHGFAPSCLAKTLDVTRGTQWCADRERQLQASYREDFAAYQRARAAVDPLASNPSPAVRQAGGIMASALDGAAASLTACMNELTALAHPPSPPPPGQVAGQVATGAGQLATGAAQAGAAVALPVGAALTATAAFIGAMGNLTVRMERGSVTPGPDQVTLRGSVYVGHQATSTWLVLRDGELTLRKGTERKAPAQGVGGTAKGQAVVSLDQVGGQGTVTGALTDVHWSSGSGRGHLEWQVGSQRLVPPSEGAFTLAVRADGNVAFGYQVVSQLCTTAVDSQGSALVPGRLDLSYMQRCGATEVSGQVQLTPTGVSGGGSLRAFGLVFPFATGGLSLGSQGLQFTGTWSGGTTGWRPVPGATGAVYRLVGSVVTAEGTWPVLAVTGRITSGAVEVKTTASRPDGQPWASASYQLPPLTISSNGLAALPLPQLPTPSPEQPRVFDAGCDAACGVITSLNLGLAAVVPSGTGIARLGQLKFVNDWRSECEIRPPGARAGNGSCKARSACLPGLTYFQGSDGKWNCRTNPPQPPAPPRLPTSISVEVGVTVK